MTKEWLNSDTEVQRTIERIYKETNIKVTVENYQTLYKILADMYDRVYEWGYDNGEGYYDI